MTYDRLIIHTHYLQMMNSDETQIQIFADWPMSHAKHVTVKEQQEKSRVSCRCRDMETTGNQKQSRRKFMASYSYILYAQHMGSKKQTYGPQNTRQSKQNDAKDRKRKCYRSYKYNDCDVRLPNASRHSFLRKRNETCNLACCAGVFWRASAFNQASAILDSNSEEAWGETKMRPREWELG